MYCYYITDKKVEDAIKISAEEYIYPFYCTGDVVSEGEKLINLWSIKEVDFWECIPRSDAGVYDKRTSPFTHGIFFNDLVYDGNSFIGAYIKEINKILYFGKNAITIINKSEFVGGMGDISEGTEYYFVENK